MKSLDLKHIMFHNVTLFHRVPKGIWHRHEFGRVYENLGKFACCYTRPDMKLHAGPAQKAVQSFVIYVTVYCKISRYDNIKKWTAM